MPGDAKALIDRYEQLRSDRKTWETIWQDVTELVRPNAEDFCTTRWQGETRSERIFDDTPTVASSRLASGLHTYLTNPTMRWFEIGLDDVALERDPAVAAWAESVSDIIYDRMRDPRVQYTQMMHELYLETVAFGTGVMLIEKRGDFISFRTFPLAACFIDENFAGFVDTVFRRIRYTKRQAVQAFGAENLPDELNRAKDDTNFEFIHCVYPRDEKRDGGLLGTDKPFASVYVSLTGQKIVSEGGYDLMPYQVVRWQKMAGEVYGRSPAMDCLQDIRVLNAATKVMLESSQMQAAPPLVTDDDGVIEPVILKPWGRIYKEAGATVEFLRMDGRALAVNMDLLNSLSMKIKRAFYNDLFDPEDFGRRDRVTATEVSDTRDAKLRGLAPMFGRFESELLNPQIERIYNILDKSGRLPRFPLNRAGNLKIRYTSPAAHAQKTHKTQGIRQFLAEMVPLSQVSPEIFDAVNMDMVVQEVASGYQVTRRALRTSEEIEAIRAARSEQQAQMAQAEQAVQMAKAFKDAGSGVQNFGNAPGVL